METVRVRRAAALAVTFHGNEIVAHAFLRRRKYSLPEDAFGLLAQASTTIDLDNLVGASPLPLARKISLLESLIEASILLIEDSPEEQEDRKFRDEWPWGCVAGYYHFTIRNMEFLAPEQQREFIREKTARSPSPPLLTDNAGLPVQALPIPKLEDEFGKIVSARESLRRYSSNHVPLATLAEALMLGNGVRKLVDAREFGILPKTFTPSGGARNPIELFVHALRIEGLKPGAYHYSALDHDLGHIGEFEYSPATCLGGQEWTNAAAGVVYLVADFSRTAWKYQQANAYRVVLMECGFIAQNILLALTKNGAGGVPIGALAETKIEQAFGIQSLTQAAILGIPFGLPENPDSEK